MRDDILSVNNSNLFSLPSYDFNTKIYCEYNCIYVVRRAAHLSARSAGRAVKGNGERYERNCLRAPPAGADSKATAGSDGRTVKGFTVACLHKRGSVPGEARNADGGSAGEHKHWQRVYCTLLKRMDDVMERSVMKEVMNEVACSTQ